MTSFYLFPKHFYKRWFDLLFCPPQHLSITVIKVNVVAVVELGKHEFMG